MTRAQLPSRALFNRFLKVFQDRLELVRRDREIKKPIPAGPAFLINLLQAFRQALVASRIVEFALMIEDGMGEAVPEFVAHRLARKFPGRLFLLACEIPRRFSGDARSRPPSTPAAIRHRPRCCKARESVSDASDRRWRRKSRLCTPAARPEWRCLRAADWFAMFSESCSSRN